MTKILELITNERMEELSAAVFDQKLEANSQSTFTNNMYEEEEIAAASQLLCSKQPDAWFAFLKRYTEHYPLFNSAINCLLDGAPNSDLAVQLLVQDFSRHSYGEYQGIRACRLALSQGIERYLPLIQAISKSGRVFSEDISRLLSELDKVSGGNSKFAETYSKAITTYRSAK